MEFKRFAERRKPPYPFSVNKVKGIVFLLLLSSLIWAQNEYVPLSYNIISSINSSYEWKKALEGEQKARDAMKYGRIQTIEKDGSIVFVGPGAEEFSKLSPQEREEAIKQDRKIYQDTLKRESFPHREKITLALQEYASYFLLWSAYACSTYDPEKSKLLLEETAKRYPDSSNGKIAKSILEKSKDQATLIASLKKEFSKLQNPVENYKPQANEPSNSIMNSLKSAISSSYEYGRWKQISPLAVKDISDIPGVDLETILSPATDLAERIAFILDERSATYYLDMAYDCYEDTQTFNYYCDLIQSRYPHTNTGKFVETAKKYRMRKEMEGR